jgi:hypothetical protein
VILERRNAMLKKHRGVSACCLVALGLLLLLAGCSGADVQGVVDLVPLQRELAAEYGESSMRVELHNGSTLGVTLVYPSLADVAWGQRAEQAREIAEFVCEHYPSMDRIDQVRIGFEVHQGGGIVDTTGSTAFVFAAGDLECGGG